MLCESGFVTVLTWELTLASGATALGSVRLKAMKTNNEQPKSFEASLEALEQIVKELEQGDLPLEKSLELFEQGIGLSRQCQERLSQAERRIEILLRDNQGRPVVSAFEDAKVISKENGTENDENVF
jgi:exodeoxyribonuclease VII small subunit